MNEKILIEIDGGKYLLGRVRPSSQTEIAEIIRRDRQKCFHDAIGYLQGLPAEQVRLAALSAFTSVINAVVVDQAETRKWMMSPSGEVFMMLHALRNGSEPKIEEPRVRVLYDKLDGDTHAKIKLFCLGPFFAGLEAEVRDKLAAELEAAREFEQPVAEPQIASASIG